MIFKIEKGKTLLESNPEIQNFPRMANCSDRTLRWIFFVYDYETPFRKLPLEDRKEKAADVVGFKREPTGRFDKNARNVIQLKLEGLSDTIAEFSMLQYDQEKDLIKGYETQIDDAIQLMKKENKSDKDWANLMKINKDLPGIIKTKKELELQVGYRTEETAQEDTGSEPLSALDMFHSKDI